MINEPESPNIKGILKDGEMDLDVSIWYINKHTRHVVVQTGSGYQVSTPTFAPDQYSTSEISEDDILRWAAEIKQMRERSS
jgi:hypothetical protein